MSDWHPTIVRLGPITSLPGSDFLELTTVMGEYPVILRKGEYHEGQLASFIPYDSVVPDIEQFHFLAPPPKKDAEGNITRPIPSVGEVPLRSRTIRAKKIRGTYSEGLIVAAPEGFVEGQEIIEHFGLTKRVYEEELPGHGDSQMEKAPTTFSLFKYDLEGLAAYGYVLQEGEEVLITEKIEGENCTIVYTEDRLWVRSRNYWKRNEEGSRWWDVPLRMGIEERLKEFPGLALWGELYGGVRHFKYDCPIVNGTIQRKFRVFDIWEIKHNRFLPWEEVEKVSAALQVETVPVLYRGPWTNDRSLHELAEGTSTIGSCVREGIVIRSVPESWHEKLGRRIVKLKGRGYKLFKD